ncbi:glycosyltransferase [Vibrio astriarenae]|uniref:Glycosyltransferase n=1 Tax=Vibrio astriarenae TaxID=1481923 RepID=A0A7Z2YES7_9VIBR|nr:glycosyltransferase [Vibrio astriarenae]QIA64429.1 glycosyltransferase [Vibrio astriarenae]
MSSYAPFRSSKHVSAFIVIRVFLVVGFMKLSIVIPCYNSGKKIASLLVSIFSQIVDSVEVVVVNDGSRDNTLETINNVLEQHGHLRDQVNVVTIENSGAGMARQVGLERAQGKYVFFCDSDDRISSDFIQPILSAIENTPDMIYFSSVVSDVDGNYIRDKIKVPQNMSLSDSSQAFNKLFSDFGYTSAVWSFVFNRSLAISSGASFINRPVHEDHMFTLTLLSNASRILFLGEVLYYYVDEEGSLTRSNKNLSYLKQRYEAYDETKGLVKTSFGSANFKLYRDWSIRSLLALVSDNKQLFYKFKNCSFLKSILINDGLVVCKVIVRKVLGF